MRATAFTMNEVEDSQSQQHLSSPNEKISPIKSTITEGNTKEFKFGNQVPLTKDFKRYL